VLSATVTKPLADHWQLRRGAAGGRARMLVDLTDTEEHP
jgi:hypothetical protein